MNGVLENTTSITFPIANPSDNVLIGTGAGGNYFGGKIDEVAIYNTALSAGDIAALYSARGTADLNDDGNSANLVGWWRMGDGVLDEYALIADQVNPTLGSELWDAAASVFTSGTYAWGPYDSNTIENDANTLKITYVDGAAGAAVAFLDDNDLSADPTIGKMYQFQCDVKVNSGSVNLFLGIRGGGSITKTITNTSFQTHKIYFIAGSGTGPAYDLIKLSSFGSGQIFWFDNLSLKEVQGNPGLMTNMTASDIVKDTP